MNKNLLIDIDCIAKRKADAVRASLPCFQPVVFQFLSRIAKELDYNLTLLIRETTEPGLKEDIVHFCSSEQIEFSEVLSGDGLAPPQRPAAGSIVKLVCTNSYPAPDVYTDDIIYFNAGGQSTDSTYTWKGIYDLLLTEPRKSSVLRTTSETDISCSINLDGNGQNHISTGLGFFDHMLQQIARHGNIDLQIDVKGDLHIDEHHTIEDVGLALGAAFSEALGNKKGIERYGFLLPMDDCLAQVAIDFGGRPWLMWDANFTREKIGDMPTEMFYHFFKSFSDTAKCNLNIKAEGGNEHHKIESIFKAFAKSIAMAVAKNNNNSIPSTKGSL